MNGQRISEFAPETGHNRRQEPLTKLLQRAEAAIPTAVERNKAEAMLSELDGVSSTKIAAEATQYATEPAALIIARLVKGLTYGEMMELRTKIWSAKGDTEITHDTLPAVLHAWATGECDAAGQ